MLGESQISEILLRRSQVGNNAKNKSKMLVEINSTVDRCCLGMLERV